MRLRCSDPWSWSLFSFVTSINRYTYSLPITGKPSHLLRKSSLHYSIPWKVLLRVTRNFLYPLRRFHRIRVADKISATAVQVSKLFTGLLQQLSKFYWVKFQKLFTSGYRVIKKVTGQRSQVTSDHSSIAVTEKTLKLSQLNWRQQTTRFPITENHYLPELVVTLASDSLCWIRERRGKLSRGFGCWSNSYGQSIAPKNLKSPRQTEFGTIWWWVKIHSQVKI